MINLVSGDDIWLQSDVGLLESWMSLPSSVLDCLLRFTCQMENQPTFGIWQVVISNPESNQAKISDNMWCIMDCRNENFISQVHSLYLKPQIKSAPLCT